MKVSVNADKLMKYVEGICSFGHRYSGSKGEAAARNYIVTEIKKVGLNVETEDFKYLHYQPIGSQLKMISPTGEDLESLPLCYSSAPPATGKAVYVGTGSEEEFVFLQKQGVDFKNKIVLASPAFSFLSYPLAQQFGATGFVALTDAPKNLNRVATATNNLKKGEIPGVTVPASVGQRLLTALSTNNLELEVSTEGEYSEKISSNIVITIPGSSLPKEQVVLTAHYDSMYLGKHAWDNATGCAGLMEIARVIAKLKPERTVKAIIFGVEEYGLCWGSHCYVEKHMEDIPYVKAVLPIDGAGTPYNPLNIFQTTEEIREFAEAIAAEKGFTIDLGGNPFPLSDHVPFQKKGVPVVWVWDGPYSPYYHTSADNPSTLDKNKLKEIIDLVGTVAIRIASTKKLPF